MPCFQLWELSIQRLESFRFGLLSTLENLSILLLVVKRDEAKIWLHTFFDDIMKINFIHDDGIFLFVSCFSSAT